MIVLPPLNIVEADLISSTILETTTASVQYSEALWASGTNYQIGNEVLVLADHNIYQCEAPHTASVRPDLDIFTLPRRWRVVRKSTRWRMFDYTRSLPTTITSPCTIVLKPSVRYDTVALHNLVSTSGTPNVEVTINSAGTAYPQYNAAPPNGDLIVRDIPPLLGNTLTVVISGAGTITLGSLLVGTTEKLGDIQRDISVDATNYSVVNRDVFGNATLVPRRSVPKVSCSIYVTAEAVNRVARLRDSLNATPALWVADEASGDYYRSLKLLGIYKTFSFSLDNPIGVFASLELEEI